MEHKPFQLGWLFVWVVFVLLVVVGKLLCTSSWALKVGFLFWFGVGFGLLFRSAGFRRQLEKLAVLVALVRFFL